MGVQCILGHKWNGCICERCGKTRDEQHKMVQNKCTQTCSVCGKKMEKHQYKHYKCEICGEKAPKPALASLGTTQSGGSTYEGYRAGSAEEAKHFLSYCTVTKPQYYIVVETPQGNWGKDKEGLYLEHLLAFQTNLSLAQCETQCAVFGKSMTMFNVNIAARGIADNFVNDIQCGACGHEWIDGIRYKNKTIVKCPNCQKYNAVDSNHINVYF